MPLFKVKISIQSIEYIAVDATSAEDAMRYVNSTNEWHEDGALDEALVKGYSFAPIGAEQITHPNQCEYDWSANNLCWCDDNDTTLTQSFYNVPYPDPNPDEDEDERAWDERQDKLDRLEVEFNAQRVTKEV